MTEPQYFGIDFGEIEARVLVAASRVARDFRRMGRSFVRAGFAAAFLGDRLRDYTETQHCWHWWRLTNDYPIRRERRVRADFHARTRAIRRTERRQGRRERRAARRRARGQT